MFEMLPQEGKQLLFLAPEGRHEAMDLSCSKAGLGHISKKKKQTPSFSEQLDSGTSFLGSCEISITEFFQEDSDSIEIGHSAFVQGVGP